MTEVIAKPKIVRGVARRHDVTTMGDVGCWFSDMDFASYIVRTWCKDLIRPGTRVLDLGAGSGNLSLALLGAGAVVTALEIDRRHEKRLRARLGDRAKVVIDDAWNPELAATHGPFDVTLTNPKWEGEWETRTLRRGCELAARTIGIISLDGLVGQARHANGWRWLDQLRELRVPPRLSFSENGATGQEHCVVVDVRGRATPRPDGEIQHVAVSHYVPPRRAR